MRILFLSHFFFPEERTAPMNLFALACDLTKNGHKVTVLTGIPNHPHGRYYDGYKLRIWQRENIGGVTILRVPLFPDHSNSVFKRVLNYLSFALSAMTIGVYLVWKIRIDVIFTYIPPLTIGLPNKIISLFHNVPVVFWVTDLWPDNLITTGKKISPSIVKIVEWLGRWVYSQAEKITVNSPGFIDNLIERGVKSNKLSVISDWADGKVFYPQQYDEELAEHYNISGKFVIMYAGNFGLGQGLDYIISAASSLQYLQRLQFVFIGDGTELQKLHDIKITEKIENVTFIPRQPMKNIGRFLALGDILLVHLIDIPVFSTQMPSKLIAYMACAKPVLCAMRGTAPKLINDACAGVTCAPSDPVAISSAIKQVYKMDTSELLMMGQNARKLYENNYTRQIQVQRVENILKKVTNKTSHI